MTPSNQQQREQTRPRISAHNATFAKIAVGFDAQCFTVHLDLLIHHSPFFRAALTGSFKEAHEKLVTLSDTNEGTFELFVHWLYHQRFPTVDDCPELLTLYRNDSNTWFQYYKLLDLYVFSDKYDVPGLKRQCLDTLFHHVTDDSQLPHFELVRDTFDSLGTDQDPLCRFLVDTYCYWSDEQCWTIEDTHGLPWAFVAQVLSRYTNFAHGGRDNCFPELCNYHNHATLKEREACEEKREKAEQAREMLTG